MAKVKLNLRGLADEAKKPEIRRELTELAEKVADAARAQGVRVEGVPGDVALPIEVANGTTHSMRVNRAKSWVTITHASGLAAQAKHGVLTKAAAAAGLEVKSR